MILFMDDTAGSALSYYDEVMADSPAGYWRLGESSGTTAVDEIAGVNGTYTGTCTLGAAGLVAGNTALSLAGGGYVKVTTSSFNYSRNFSVEALIRPSGSGDRAIITRTTGGFYLRLAGNGKLQFIKSYVVGISFGNTILTNGNVYHVGLSVGSGATAPWKLYVNGALDASGTTAETFSAPSGQLGIGAEWGTTWGYNRWHGEIDEVAVYSSELPAARFAAHYAAI